MSIRRNLLSLALLSVASLFAEDLPPRIIPKDPSPFNDDVKIEVYTNGIVTDKTPFYLKTRSFPLGVRSQSDSLKGFRSNPKGTTILVVLNGQERIYVTKKDNYPLVEERTYFNKRLSKTIPSEVGNQLPPGKVTIHAIALTSFDESIKEDGATSVVIIDYKTRSDDSQKWVKDLQKPYVIYNQPYGKYRPGKPILLDFYLYNVQLSKNGYHLKVTIDGKEAALLDSWVPYGVEGLPPGEHKVHLELVDAKGRIVANPFGPQEETIVILK